MVHVVDRRQEGASSLVDKKFVDHHDDDEDLTERTTQMIDDSESSLYIREVCHDDPIRESYDSDANTQTTWSRSSYCTVSSSHDEQQDSNFQEEDLELGDCIYDEESSNDEVVVVEPKSLPSPSGSYKVICLSFLEPDIATSVASTVAKEALRMLRSGGLLYVVDGHGIVRKLPILRQLLRRCDTEEHTVEFKVRYEVQLMTHLVDTASGNSVSHTPVLLLLFVPKIHDIEAREILQTNGFEAPVSPEIVRWMGRKP